ncbi:MAG: hypothetical protein ACTSRU_19990, partial [Candidatus Hodarchaeales archaeon]
MDMEEKGGLLLMSLHFIVTGKFITDFAREAWTEGDMKRAYSTVRQINGLREEDFIPLFTGKKKLIGASICEDPDCSQCKGLSPIQLIKDEDQSCLSAEKIFERFQERLSKAY